MPATFRARTPDDLLALAPILMGFTPTDCLLLLSLDPPGSAHLRLDLDEVHTLLPTDRVLSYLGERVVVVTYCTDLNQATDITRAALATLESAENVEVLTVLTADGTCWRPWMGTTYPDQGAPYDTATHPFTLQAHYDGRTVHPDRDTLAASLLADTSRTELVLEDAYAELQRHLGGNRPGWVAGHAVWMTDRLHAWVQDPTIRPTDYDVAWLAVTAQFTDVLTTLLAAIDTLHTSTATHTHGEAEPADEDTGTSSRMSPGVAAARVATVLVDVAARTPAALAAPLRIAVAHAALRDGNGALAALALELAEEADPDHPHLADLAARLHP